MQYGRIKGRAADRSILEPSACGQSKYEIDDGRKGGQQPQLKRICAKSGGVDGDKGDGATVQHAKPGDVKDEMIKIRAVLGGNGPGLGGNN